eukprot:1069655-Heterocapsa_arctica.AAC.1
MPLTPGTQDAMLVAAVLEEAPIPRRQRNRVELSADCSRGVVELPPTLRAHPFTGETYREIVE